jgi:hypothetical protein
MVYINGKSSQRSIIKYLKISLMIRIITVILGINKETINIIYVSYDIVNVKKLQLQHSFDFLHA